MQFRGFYEGKTDEKPISESSLQENGKCSHHPILYQGSVCVLKAAEKIFPAVFGGFVITKISLPEDADLCGCSGCRNKTKMRTIFGVSTTTLGFLHPLSSPSRQFWSIGVSSSGIPRSIFWALWSPLHSSKISDIPSSFLIHGLFLLSFLCLLISATPGAFSSLFGAQISTGKEEKKNVHPALQNPCSPSGDPNFPSAPSHGEEAL